MQTNKQQKIGKKHKSNTYLTVNRLTLCTQRNHKLTSQIAYIVMSCMRVCRKQALLLLLCNNQQNTASNNNDCITK